MKKLLVSAPALLLLVACDQQPDSKQAIENIQGPQNLGHLYAGKPTEYTWPVIEQAGAIQISASLLAQNYYLVIDGSGSMDEVGCSGNRKKIDVAKEAVNQFIDSIPKDANVGLLVFDDKGIGERVALSVDHDSVKQEVQNISANGGTPLLEAMSRAYSAITAQGQQQLGYGEYHMVVVTDGEANTGQDPGRIVDTILRASPITLHTIGFCIGNGHSLNVPGLTDYRAANNPDELLAGLQSVLAESAEYPADKFDSGGVKP
ncbi:hypothetical protein GCM10011613_07590 [Cellvibrio zantedeschiae]|uniref:VWFA domain-containing protein n=1 Tax=Cellvibrio zantedeschiae TaxID=1237077 RepID=A0ABQ3ATI7_9GAMM|nr:vWA domain-containing protein [Cellvibrio zantedeschiae]GGY66169.1 hypothetical protein GCM10011613_07590 [Cellvibrio zantedeschiae]